jgi:hypothetical protein
VWVFIDFWNSNNSAILVTNPHDIWKACHRHLISEVAGNRSELTFLSVPCISGVPSAHEEIGRWFGPASTVEFSDQNYAVLGIKALPQRYLMSMRYRNLWYRIDIVSKDIIKMSQSGIS